jgi:hypothetical protein
MITSARTAKTDGRNPTFCDGHHRPPGADRRCRRARACVSRAGQRSIRIRLISQRWFRNAGDNAPRPQHSVNWHDGVPAVRRHRRLPRKKPRPPPSRVAKTIRRPSPVRLPGLSRAAPIQNKTYPPLNLLRFPPWLTNLDRQTCIDPLIGLLRTYKSRARRSCPITLTGNRGRSVDLRPYEP